MSIGGNWYRGGWGEWVYTPGPSNMDSSNEIGGGIISPSPPSVPVAGTAAVAGFCVFLLSIWLALILSTSKQEKGDY